MTLSGRRIAWLLLAAAPAAAFGQPPGEPGTAVVCIPETEPVARERFWVRGEYVAWATTTPDALSEAEEATASPLFDTVLALTGAGREDVARAAFQGRTGYRLTAGVWADPAATCGLEASYMYLSRRPVRAPVAPGQLSELSAIFAGVALPGLGGGGGGTIVVPVTAAGVAGGAVRFELGDQTIRDFQLLGRACLAGGDGWRVDGVAGYRWLSFEERLGVSAVTTATGLPLVAGSTLAAGSAVRSESVFQGLLVGADFAACWGCWEAGVRPSVTVARVENEITRRAFARAAVPRLPAVDLAAGPFLIPAGLSRDTFTECTAVPQVDFRLARSFGEHVRVVVGASVLALPSVARATGQLDVPLPTAQVVPGLTGVPLAATVLRPDLDTVIVGTVSAGLEFRY